MSKHIYHKNSKIWEIKNNCNCPKSGKACFCKAVMCPNDAVMCPNDAVMCQNDAVMCLNDADEVTNSANPDQRSSLI